MFALIFATALCSASALRTVDPQLVAIYLQGNTVQLDSLDDATGALDPLFTFSLSGLIPNGDCCSAYDAENSTLLVPAFEVHAGSANTFALSEYNVADKSGTVVDTPVAILAVGLYQQNTFAVGQSPDDLSFACGAIDRVTGAFAPMGKIPMDLATSLVEAFDADKGVFYMEMHNATSGKFVLVTCSVVDGMVSVNDVQAPYQLSTLHYDPKNKVMSGIVFDTSKASYFVASTITADAQVTVAGMPFPFAQYSLLIGVDTFDPATNRMFVLFYEPVTADMELTTTDVGLVGMGRGVTDDRVPHIVALDVTSGAVVGKAPIAGDGSVVFSELAFLY